MGYRIEWDIRAYKELKALENKEAVNILNAINKIMDNPKNQKQLKGKFQNKYRLRVGDYRVIYWINDKENIIYILSVGHRKNIYF